MIFKAKHMPRSWSFCSFIHLIFPPISPYVLEWNMRKLECNHFEPNASIISKRFEIAQPESCFFKQTFARFLCFNAELFDGVVSLWRLYGGLSGTVCFSETITKAAFNFARLPCMEIVSSKGYLHTQKVQLLVEQCLLNIFLSFINRLKNTDRKREPC